MIHIARRKYAGQSTDVRSQFPIESLDLNVAITEAARIERGNGYILRIEAWVDGTGVKQASYAKGCAEQ